MSQSKRGSVLEAVANTAIGYGVAVGAQELIFPLFGLHLPFTSNLLMGLLFTVISLVRSYTLRRLFNRRVEIPASQVRFTWKGYSLLGDRASIDKVLELLQHEWRAGRARGYVPPAAQEAIWGEYEKGAL